MRDKAIAALAAFCCIFGAHAATASATEHTKDSLDTVKQQIKDGKATLVDVREQKEWDAGHIEGAVFVPLGELSKHQHDKEFVAELKTKLPKDKVIYCHCAKGRRALSAADIFKDLGYDVRPLKPGYQELIEEGFKKAPDKKP